MGGRPLFCLRTYLALGVLALCLLALTKITLHAAYYCSRTLNASHHGSVKNLTKSKDNANTTMGNVRGGGATPLWQREELEPYTSKDALDFVLSPFQSQTAFMFIAYCLKTEAVTYPDQLYVAVAMPLATLVKKATMAQGRKAASCHGVFPGTRCTRAILSSVVADHACTPGCLEYVAIFAPKLSIALTATQRSIKRRKEAFDEHANASVEVRKSPSFPPPPLSQTDFLGILRSGSAAFTPKNFEEGGCAVCGELKPRSELKPRRHLKRAFHVLEVDGVSRLERKKPSDPIKGYAQVFDHKLNEVCTSCREAIRDNKMPRMALANGTWLGEVPEALKNLRFVEKLLIARVRHTCNFVKVASGMRKMKANVICFESPIPKVYTMLPPPRADLDDVLAILFTGPTRPTLDDFNRTPFLVRRNSVIQALNWLKLNHSDYADIIISKENIEQYPEDKIPVSIEYREAVTNKVSEGTSVHDTEIDDGAELGACPFQVHGLTGDTLNTMPTSTIKAHALRHLNEGGKMLAVGRSAELESIWNNPQLYPQMFPWLFPYGLGGIGTANLSDREHKRHLLMYHDKRFQTDINFPFVAFSHEQIKSATTQSFLLSDRQNFSAVTNRLLNLNQTTLSHITERLIKGEAFHPETDDEKACFDLLKDVDHVGCKTHGSTMSKKAMRNEIWSLIAAKGAPIWYITLSPADIQHPLCLYYATAGEEFKPDLLPYDERVRLVCNNPVAGARFFHYIVTSFIVHVLGVSDKKMDHTGLYGQTEAFYGTVEQQGRLTLHLHMLLWISGTLSPQVMRERLLNNTSAWREEVIAYLETCHSGDFFSESQEVVGGVISSMTETESGYCDPTQTMPESPPPPCPVHTDDFDDVSCADCGKTQGWLFRFRETVDDLLFWSNVHKCNRFLNKDGTRRKAAAAGCMDNRWGKCKARFPRALQVKTEIDEVTGAIIMKKSAAWLNTFSPPVTYLLRCNTDVTCLMSGTAIKAVVMYVSDYITKSVLKTHTIFDSIRATFQKNSEMIGGTLPEKEKARRLMTKVVNIIGAKMEMGAPMICMYLLGNPDHYTNYTFVNLYWQSYVAEVRRSFDAMHQEKALPVIIVRQNSKLLGISFVLDYMHRPFELSDMALVDFVRQCKRQKILTQTEGKNSRIPKRSDGRRRSSGATDTEEEDDVGDEAATDGDNVDMARESLSEKKLPKNWYRFTETHPLHQTHAIQQVAANRNVIPNFVGATLPRSDRGDREYYCATMLTLFKPWRTGRCLKGELESWDEAFVRCEDEFKVEHKIMLSNFNIRYECLDARDDYRAQLKTGADPAFVSSWDEDGEEAELEVFDYLKNVGGVDGSDNEGLDGMVTMGARYLGRLQLAKEIKETLQSAGWTMPNEGLGPGVSTDFEPIQADPSGLSWKQQIETAQQKLQDRKLEDLTAARKAATEKENIGFCGSLCFPNQVRIVDKAYLNREGVCKKHCVPIETVGLQFKLNSEQMRAFMIIANHATCPESEPLNMYLGGMGGTGKSQVLKALSAFFMNKNEAHRFVVVAPTGNAAALLGGSTYHHTFGVIEGNISSAGMSRIREKLIGVEYVFFDEVSMLSCRDLYRIHHQLSTLLGKPHLLFGGLNMVFCGDFAQLPPVIGRENAALYTSTAGLHANDLASQEEGCGKASWHEVTTVVILRENMRQKSQTPEDAKLRTALENMRYKACTAEDIEFLRSRVSSKVPGRSNICDPQFRDASIITARNAHKDEINQLGTKRFAEERGLKLIDFFSQDSVNTSEDGRSRRRGAKSKLRYLKELTPEIRGLLWDIPTSACQEFIPGKLSLCVGLPVMIRHNFATDLCITKGQEGTVYGWHAYKNDWGDLPDNVVPIYSTSKSTLVHLPDDTDLRISRKQVELLPNFAMTDFASQGKTRAYNVVHLNYLNSHQAYYTALSRSASAAGTLIVQGIDRRVITGGASGQLRQELRELEILDDITRLRYLGKLPPEITGTTRNWLIKRFREWKGENYIPSSVHRALRWSKRDPFVTRPPMTTHDERYNAGDLKRKRQTTKETEKEGEMPSDKEDELCDAEPRKRVKVESSPKNHGTRKDRGERTGNMKLKERVKTKSRGRMLSRVSAEYRGFIWGRNSCAFDALLTILFAQWSDKPCYWESVWRKESDSVVTQIGNIFAAGAQNVDALEGMRDELRTMLESENATLFKFGSYIGLSDLMWRVGRTADMVYTTYFECENHHVRRMQGAQCNNLLYDLGGSMHESTATWASSMGEDDQESRRVCHCGLRYWRRTKYISKVPLIFLYVHGSSCKISESISIQMDEGEERYRVKGVIYFGGGHFISRIISGRGIVYVHDGMTTGRDVLTEGYVKDVDLSMVANSVATAAIYERIA